MSDSKKVKISQTIGLKVGTMVNGAPDYKNVFLDINDLGTEVEMSEKDIKYVIDAKKRLMKSQEILKKYLGA